MREAACRQTPSELAKYPEKQALQMPVPETTEQFGILVQTPFVKTKPAEQVAQVVWVAKVRQLLAELPTEQVFPLAEM